MAEELYLVYQVTPDEAMEYMWDSTKVLVDIRNIYDYENDHLDNSINIPAASLLNTEFKSTFDQWLSDSTLVVFYGQSEAEATSPWMLMYQLGYTNTRTLMGGMGYFDKMYNDELQEGESYNVEEPLFDYAGIIEAGSTNQVESLTDQPGREVVVRRKEKKAAEGGC